MAEVIESWVELERQLSLVCAQGRCSGHLGCTVKTKQSGREAAAQQQKVAVLGVHLGQDGLCSAIDKEQAAAGQAG